MDAVEIYLPENPLELCKRALDSLSFFESQIVDIEVDYLLTANDKFVPTTLSLSAAIIHDEYKSLEMFKLSKRMNNQGYISVRLNDLNAYYMTHVNFIQAIVNGNPSDMVDFILPRCVVKIDNIPNEYEIYDPLNSNGMILKEFNHSSFVDSFSTYMLSYIDNFNMNVLTGMDIILTRFTYFEKFFKEHLMYVPV